MAIAGLPSQQRQLSGVRALRAEPYHLLARALFLDFAAGHDRGIGDRDVMYAGKSVFLLPIGMLAGYVAVRGYESIAPSFVGIARFGAAAQTPC